MRFTTLMIFICLASFGHAEAKTKKYIAPNEPYLESRPEPDDIVPAEERLHPWSGQLPLCEDASVLGTISQRFDLREALYWNSALSIKGFEDVQPIDVSQSIDTIPRRTCRATLTTSDGVLREVKYTINESLGFLGVGWNVDWCVSGLEERYESQCVIDNR